MFTTKLFVVMTQSLLINLHFFKDLKTYSNSGFEIMVIIITHLNYTYTIYIYTLSQFCLSECLFLSLPSSLWSFLCLFVYLSHLCKPVYLSSVSLSVSHSQSVCLSLSICLSLTLYVSLCASTFLRVLELWLPVIFCILYVIVSLKYMYWTELCCYTAL